MAERALGGFTYSEKTHSSDPYELDTKVSSLKDNMKS
jgi:hypothetical protein